MLNDYYILNLDYYSDKTQYDVSTRKENLDFNKCIGYEKKDGSQVTGLVLDSNNSICDEQTVFFKTNKSFYSDVAINANKNATLNEINLTIHLDECGYTSIFEYTDPEWQIVVNYGDKPTFTLLAARHKVTGEYLSREILESVALIFDVVIVKEYHLTIDEMLSEVDNVKGREGYVILLANGTRLKLKFDWYRIHHRVRTEMRTRDIAELVADSLIDDVKSVIVESGENLALIEEIERQVVGELLAIQEYVEHEVNMSKGMLIKDVAAKYRKDACGWLILQHINGQEVKYIKFWKTNYLKKYPLKCVYNPNF